MTASPLPAPRRLVATTLAFVLVCSACGGPAANSPNPRTGGGGAPAPVDRSLPTGSAAVSEGAIPEPKPHGGPMSTTRGLGWIVFAVGASAAAVAISTSFMMLHESSVRDTECDAQKRCSPDGIQANARLSSLGGWNAAAWTVAAAGIGAGMFLVLTGGASEGERQTALGVSPNGSGAGLNLRSTF